jgi:hypothetical protein
MCNASLLILPEENLKPVQGGCLATVIIVKSADEDEHSPQNKHPDQS